MTVTTKIIQQLNHFFERIIMQTGTRLGCRTFYDQELQWSKVCHNGPEETTYMEQEVWYHKEMITVNGWCAGGIGEGVGKWSDEQSDNGGDGERFLSKLSLTFS